jgi:hypothetical protein
MYVWQPQPLSFYTNSKGMSGAAPVTSSERCKRGQACLWVHLSLLVTGAAPDILLLFGYKGKSWDPKVLTLPTSLPKASERPTGSQNLMM